jgi:Flp pilus assembly protein TadG
MNIAPSSYARRALRIFSDRRGAVIIEFAFVAIPFFALMLAILQTSLVYFAAEALETGVEASARSVITGKAQLADANGKTQGMSNAQLAERFRTAACAAIPTFLKCSKLIVEVKSASTWAGIDSTVPVLTYDASGKVTNAFSYDLGSGGAIVLVRLMYPWPIEADPLVRLAKGNTGTRLLVATSVGKSEAYQ